MSSFLQKEVTRLLLDWNEGDESALEKLMPLVYDHLHEVARLSMKRERADHTLQPTALVHETYMRLVDQKRIRWQNRAQFFAIAAQMMRRILVDHARYHARNKRMGPSRKIVLDENQHAAPNPPVDILGLDEALKILATMDERQAHIVELRYFGGMTVEDTAEALGISPATVKREWSMARAWLRLQLRKGTSQK